MKKIIKPEQTSIILSKLTKANQAFEKQYLGKSLMRQPIHTVYGGAHLFKADTAIKIGKLAQKSLNDFAPDFVTFARALALKGADTFPNNIGDIESLIEESMEN